MYKTTNLHVIWLVPFYFIKEIYYQFAIVLLKEFEIKRKLIWFEK